MKPLKATEAVVVKILDGIRRGLTQEKALILAGITRQSMHRWKKANEKIQHRFDEAETEVEASLVDSIMKATKDDWKAANWILERRFTWQQMTKTELTGKDGGPIQQTTLSKQLLASVGGKGDGYVTERKRKGPLPATATEHGTTNQVIDVTAKVVTQHDTKHDASPDAAT